MHVKRHLQAVGLWSLLWAIFFSTLLLGIKRLPNSDLSGQFHTFALFQAREMWSGHLPLWSPGSYAGVPFAADPQAAVFYPLRWLTILIGGRNLPYYLLQLEGLLHIWLAGVFTYALAYAMTRSRWAALLAAVSFALGGYLISYPLLQLALLETITWLPLVLLLLHRATANSTRPLRYLLAAGSVLGFSFLAGHPQTFLQASYLAAAYYLFRTLYKRWHWKWIVGGGTAVAAAALGVAAVAWLPTLHYLTYTTRSDVTYEFIAKGFSLLDYMQMLTPGTLTFWVPMYTGLAAVALALIACWGRHETTRETHAEILFWGGTAVLAAWLSLGDKGVLFALFYRLAPGFSLFRQQERWVNGVSLSMSLLAAQGLALWLRSSGQTQRRWVYQLTAVIGSGLLLSALILWFAQSFITAHWTDIILRQIVLTAMLCAVLWLVRKSRVWLLALLLLLVSDLFLAGQGPLDLQPDSASIFWPQPAWLSLLNTSTDTMLSSSPARVDAANLFHANLGEVYGLEDIRGISPLKPQVLADLEQLPAPRRWQLLNVTHVLSATPMAEPGLVEVGRIDSSLLPGESFTGIVYQNTTALPRAWMVYEPLLVPDATAAREKLNDPTFDPAHQVLLTTPPPATTAPTTAPQVQVERKAANALTITVTTETAGLLVISEWDYPGWLAVVDGVSIPLLSANYAFQAVPLQAGTHHVSLRFMPWDVPMGVGITAVSLLLIFLLGWRWQPVLAYHGTAQRRRTRKPLPPLVMPALSAKQWRFLIIAIVWLGFGLRLFHLGAQELRGDEAFSYLFAHQPAAQIIGALVREGDPHSPLHYLLLHGWMNLAGDSEFAMRYLSLIPGVLVLPLLVLLGQQIGGRRLGVGVGVSTAVSQSLVWISQDVRNQYTLAIFFTVLGTWLLLRLTDPQRAGPAQRHFLWIGYAFTAALAVYSYYYALFALGAHGLYLLTTSTRRRWLGVWLGSGAVAGLLFLPWLLAMWPQLMAAGQLNDPAYPELTRYLTAIGAELTAGSTLGSSIGRWLFLGTLMLCLMGLYRLWQRQQAWSWLLLGWLGSAVLFIYLVQFRRATFNTFYITVASPAWWLLVLIGIQSLWQRDRRGQYIAVSAFLLLVGANIYSLQQMYFVRDLGRDIGYREMVAHIAAAQEPGDVFLAHFPDPALRYYLRNLDLPYQMLPDKPDATAAATETALTTLTNQYQRIWFVPYTGWDRENIVPLWLQYHTLTAQQSSQYKLTLQAFRPFADADAVLTPIHAALAGDSMTLDGVFVTVNGRMADTLPSNTPLPLAINDTLAVTLVWQAVQPISDNYAVFVHILAADGSLLAQHDGIPVWGTRPTTTWQPGDRIFDTHEFTLPVDVPTAGGRIVVGLYQTETVTRLPFADGQDVLPLTAVSREP